MKRLILILHGPKRAMRKRIVSDLGPESKILVLRNHGVAFCGQTVEEVWFWLFTFMVAAEIQMKAMSAANGVQNLVVPPGRVLDQVQSVIRKGVNERSSDGIDWKLGEMDLEAEMRRLDRLVY
jgi:ribulose-5-phosphate 4-epimerase/fuculose-1-phosphate aldolase